MSLKKKILDELKQAMLDKNELTRDTLRMVKADFMNKEVELGRDLSEQELVGILQRAVKTRRDSEQQYVDGGREDLAEKERAEIGVVERYLPRQLDDEETRAAIEAVVSDLGLSGKKDLGKVMKELKARHGAAVDGRAASRIAGEVLG